MEKIIIELKVTDRIKNKIRTGISNAYLHELLKNDLMLGYREKINVYSDININI